MTGFFKLFCLGLCLAGEVPGAGGLPPHPRQGPPPRGVPRADRPAPTVKCLYIYISIYPVFWINWDSELLQVRGSF